VANAYDLATERVDVERACLGEVAHGQGEVEDRCEALDPQNVATGSATGSASAPVERRLACRAPTSNPEEPHAMDADVILVDEPLPLVRRITMNRPDKRNSLIHPLRGAILDTL